MCTDTVDHHSIVFFGYISKIFYGDVHSETVQVTKREILALYIGDNLKNSSATASWV